MRAPFRPLAFAAFSALAFFTSAAPARTITVGVTEPVFADGGENAEEKTLAYLKGALPQHDIRLQRFSNRNLKEQIEAARPDFLISSSSSYLQVAWTLGAHRILHKRNTGTTDIQHAVSSVFIVKAQDPRTALKDLKGDVAGARSELGFDDWLIARGELERIGEDSTRFFSRVHFTETTGISVPGMLRRGIVDVGVLPACALERLEQSGGITPGEFRIVGDRTEPDDVCRRSTDAYPDLVFSSLPWANPNDVKGFIIALLTLPESSYGFEWSPAHDLNPTLALLKRLKLPPYEYLNDRTFGSLLKEYRVELSFAALLLFGTLLHSLRANWLVRKRTKELNEATAAREQMTRAASDAKEKMAELERLATVSIMSKLFAHEIRQPVTNILFYASTLDVLIRSGKLESAKLLELTEKIAAQARRSDEIVKHLRAYAKNPESEKTQEPLAAILERACSVLPADGMSFLKVEAPEGVSIYCNAFEIEFVLGALLKNAVESLREVNAPSIELSVAERQDGMLEISVSDNGPKIDPARFSQLGTRLESNKKNGLGLGLAIASEIAERHGGRLEFKARIPSGLVASLILPKEPS